MRILAVLTVSLTLTPQATSAPAQDYLRLRTGVMQSGAALDAVDRVLDLLSETVVYEHPAARMRIAGKDAIRKAMASQLGRTRNARSKVHATTGLTNASALIETLEFETRDGEAWRHVSRTQLLLFEYEAGKISRIIEYWEK